MATALILAGGSSSRMPGDKAFMELNGRCVIDMQLEELSGCFDEVLIVSNDSRAGRLAKFECPGVSVLVESYAGAGPLGGIVSGLAAASSTECFVLACDMPFVKAAAAVYMLERLAGFQVAVPETPGGLEPLFAAYHTSCLPAAHGRLERGEYKVTGFYDEVLVNRVPHVELMRYDRSGRLLLNVNRPEDLIS